MQPFKCGPDYIDTKYHDTASGNKSVNLDLFLSSARHVAELYAKYSLGKDVCIAEGAMGLFDGYDGMQGSCAETAKLLKIPVVLVVNAKSAAYSVAPLLYGFRHFDAEVNVAGAIFNFVGSESHCRFLNQACIDAGVKLFGCLPKNAGLEIPSRYLGLTLENERLFDEFADRAAAAMEQYIDLDALLAFARTYGDVQAAAAETRPATVGSKIRIAVASDEAFNFTYRENMERLKARGDIAFFSPLRDSRLPEADFVYFPGGYPEMFLEQLCENTELHGDIRAYVAGGGRALAECGGMMYLSSSIADAKGREYPMVGIFSQKASMKNMKLTLGYRSFNYNGFAAKGHEFHYSHCETEATSVAQQYNAAGVPVDTKLLRRKNAIAGYTHIYWGETDNLFDMFN